jgi:AraC family transcriptional activator of mtrCDE
MNLHEIQPLVGSAHYFLYSGGFKEQQRRGNSYAFHLFISNGGRVWVNGKIYEVKVGDLLFVRPGEAHAFLATPEETIRSYNIYVNLCYDAQDAPIFPKFQYDDQELVLHMVPLCESPELDALPSFSSIALGSDVMEHFKQIVKAFQHKGVNTQKSVQYLFTSWLLRWYDAVMNSGPSDQRIQRLVATFRDRDDTMSIDEMADACELGRTRFFRLFHQQTGMTPNAYVMQCRMERAMILLQEGRYSVTEVAEMLRYPSIHYFSRQFTQYYGVNPSRVV